MDVNYVKFDHDYHRHHQRFKRRVESQKHKLPCQECRGRGGYIEPVLDYGEGPFFICGWCEGTGLLTPWLRGRWLALRKLVNG